MVLWALPLSARAQTVTELIGSNVFAGIPYPSVLGTLCAGTGANLNCPQFFHPDWSQPPGTRFFGVTNRVNPPIFLTSTSGAVWTAVPTQPFIGAVLNLGASVGVSSSGALVAIAGQGLDTCLIRRSTDQGSTWSTVFTDATQVCTLVFGSPTPPGLSCSELNGYCAFIVPSNPGAVTTIFSTDNGGSWFVGASTAYASADSRVWGPVLDSAGSAGIITRGINSLIGQPFGIKIGGEFQATSSYIPSPLTNRNCRPFLRGSTPFAVCVPNAGGNSYQLVSGGIPAQIGATFSLTDAAASVNEPLVHGRGSISYIVQPSATIATRLNLYLSTDQFNSGAILASTLTLPTTIIGGCCKGNIIGWGSRTYFSSGSSGSQAFFVAIQ